MQDIHHELHSMTSLEIQQAAYDRLQLLLTRCTIHLVQRLTHISRPTLYRWLNTDRALEQMDRCQCITFIVMFETEPKIRMLLERPPLKYPRLASRVIAEDTAEEGEQHEQA